MVKSMLSNLGEQYNGLDKQIAYLKKKEQS